MNPPCILHESVSDRLGLDVSVSYRLGGPRAGLEEVLPEGEKDPVQRYVTPMSLQPKGVKEAVGQVDV